MLWLFVRPIRVYLLDFFCYGLQFYLLLGPYFCFITLLDAQTRRDNLKFHGFDDNRRETWEESENTVRRYISEELNIDDSAIKIERAHCIRSRNSLRPIIVKFSHYKDGDCVLKSFREKRRSRLADNAQGLMGENRNGNDGAEAAITFVLVKTSQNALLKCDQNCTHF